MNPLEISTLILATSIIALHYVTIKKHFQPAQNKLPINAIMLVMAINYFFVATNLSIHDQPVRAFTISIALQIISLIVFLSAIYSSRNHSKLGVVMDGTYTNFVIKNGIYGYIRHPFYTSYILFWTGLITSMWMPVGILGAFLFYTIYSLAAKHEEHMMVLNEETRDEYRGYMETTGTFFPRPGRMVSLAKNLFNS